ncbi:type II secretion system F family protein [Ornithinimicrobium sp. W1679]|uniref:type II secretion system F family protein n=1 Tax=Ornithinimicrobium sp. W1679 TaxID=3418770 RepID=UPI003CF04E10
MDALMPTAGLWAGVGLVLLASLVAVVILLVPSKEVALERRRYGVAPPPSVIARTAAGATGALGSLLDRGGRGQRWANTLDRAGIRRDPAEFALLVGAAALMAFAIGVLISSVFTAVLLAGFAVVGAYLYVMFRSDRRKTEFGDQLDDLLQLLASNLRAGHSILQSLDSVARELDEPAGSEITRVVNQVRVGRDLGQALDESAERMDSDDFRWVSQAIAIHRQVGGNLADVLDTVGETIRERGQIRRQVKALAAEGKLSAIILMLLPFVVVLMLAVTNPEYIGTLTGNLLGWVLIFVGLALITVGGLWLRKVIEVKF